MDSLRHLKDTAYLIAKGYIKLLRDTMEMDATDEQDALEQIKTDKEELMKNQLPKDSNENKLKDKPQAILPEEKKKPELKDSLNNKP
jgi:hypothetical protein